MYHYTAPEINILPVPDIVSSSRHFVPVTRSSYRSQLATIILKECNSNLDKKQSIQYKSIAFKNYKYFLQIGNIQRESARTTNDWYSFRTRNCFVWMKIIIRWIIIERRCIWRQLDIVYLLEHSSMRAQNNFCRYWFTQLTILIWKPTGYCDQQKTNPAGHTWNRAG